MNEQTIFTDSGAALEEMRYMAEETGQPQAVVSVLQVVDYEEAVRRGLVIIEMQSPEVRK